MELSNNQLSGKLTIAFSVPNRTVSWVMYVFALKSGMLSKNERKWVMYVRTQAVGQPDRRRIGWLCTGIAWVYFVPCVVADLRTWNVGGQSQATCQSCDADIQ